MDNIKKQNIEIDKVYVIHCAENVKRLKNIEFQQKTNKWLNDKLEIWWTCYHPFSNIMANAMLLSNMSRYLSNGNELNLVREFYTIIKTSYLRNYNYICIFEDDFSLINENLFNQFINTLPYDFDLIQLSLQGTKKQYNLNKLINDYINKGILWEEKTFGAWSNNGILLSRKGMEYYINSIDNELQAADIPMHESKNDNPYYGKLNQSGNNIKHYIPTIPIVYINGVESTVQDESNEEQDDLYEQYDKLLNKKMYNIL